jgi:hypothetical protein
LEHELNPNEGVYFSFEPYHSRLVNDVARLIEAGYELLRVAGALGDAARLSKGSDLYKIYSAMARSASELGRTFLGQVDQMYIDLGSRNKDAAEIFEKAAKRTGYMLPNINVNPIQAFDRFVNTWVQRFLAAGGYWSKVAESSRGIGKLLSELASVVAYTAAYLAQMVPTKEAFEAGLQALETVLNEGVSGAKKVAHDIWSSVSANKESIIGFIVASILLAALMKKVGGALREWSPRLASIMDALSSAAFGDPIGFALGLVEAVSREPLQALPATTIRLVSEAERQRLIKEIAEDFMRRGVSRDAAYKAAAKMMNIIERLSSKAKVLEEIPERLRETGGERLIDVSSTLSELARSLADLETELKGLEKTLAKSVVKAVERLRPEPTSLEHLVEHLKAVAANLEEEHISSIEKTLEELKGAYSRLTEAFKEAKLPKDFASALEKDLKAIISDIEKGLVKEKPSSLISTAENLLKAVSNIGEEFGKAKEKVIEIVGDVVESLPEPLKPEGAKVLQELKAAQTTEDLMKGVRDLLALLARNLDTRALDAIRALRDWAKNLLSNKRLVETIALLSQSLRDESVITPIRDLIKEAAALEDELKQAVAKSNIVLLEGEDVRSLLQKINRLSKENPDLAPILSRIKGFFEKHPYIGGRELDEFIDLVSDIVKRYGDNPEMPLTRLYDVLSEITRDLVADVTARAKDLANELRNLQLGEINPESIASAVKNRLEGTLNELAITVSERVEPYRAIADKAKEIVAVLRNSGAEKAANAVEKAVKALEEAVEKGSEALMEERARELLKTLRKAVGKLEPNILKRVGTSILDSLKSVYEKLSRKGPKTKMMQALSELVHETLADIEKELEKLKKGKGAAAYIKFSEEKLKGFENPSEAAQILSQLGEKTIRVGDTVAKRKVEIEPDGTVVIRYRVETPSGNWIEYVERLKPFGKDRRLVSTYLVLDPELEKLLASSPLRAERLLEEGLSRLEEVIRGDPDYALLRRIYVRVKGLGARALAKLLEIGADAMRTLVAGAIAGTALLGRSVKTAPPVDVKAFLSSKGITYSGIVPYEPDKYIVLVPLDTYDRLSNMFRKIRIEIKVNGSKVPVIAPSVPIGPDKWLVFLPVVKPQPVTIPSPQLGGVELPSVKPLPGGVKSVGEVTIETEKETEEQKQEYEPATVTVTKPSVITQSVTLTSAETTTTTTNYPKTRGRGGIPPIMPPPPFMLNDLGAYYAGLAGLLEKEKLTI